MVTLWGREVRYIIAAEEPHPTVLVPVSVARFIPYNSIPLLQPIGRRIPIKLPYIRPDSTTRALTVPYRATSTSRTNRTRYFELCYADALCNALPTEHGCPATCSIPLSSLLQQPQTAIWRNPSGARTFFPPKSFLCLLRKFHCCSFNPKKQDRKQTPERITCSGKEGENSNFYLCNCCISRMFTVWRCLPRTGAYYEFHSSDITYPIKGGTTTEAASCC